MQSFGIAIKSCKIFLVKNNQTLSLFTNECDHETVFCFECFYGRVCNGYIVGFDHVDRSKYSSSGIKIQDS